MYWLNKGKSECDSGDELDIEDIEEEKQESGDDSDSQRDSDNDGEGDEDDACSESDHDESEDENSGQQTADETPPSSAETVKAIPAGVYNPHLPEMLKKNKKRLKTLVSSLKHKLIFKQVEQFQPRHKLRR